MGITVGVAVSFAVLTLTISYLVSLLGFDPDILRFVAVVILLILGLSLLVPAFSARLEAMVSKVSSKAGGKRKEGNSFLSGFVTGASLGIVWSPCAGPILATIATLASTRAVNSGIILVTIFYVAGLSIPLFFFSYGGNLLIEKSRLLNRYTGRIRQFFGLVIILTALSIYTNYDKVLQVNLLDAFPSYSTFLFNLEGNKSVSEQLSKLKSTGSDDMVGKPFKPLDMAGSADDRGSGAGSLPNLGRVPDFTGINSWLNSDALSLSDLQGKVVLIDFWTYTCINCIRTLPHVTSWHEKYKDSNFTVIGVHTPEFEFEKDRKNVEMAISQYKITYPVAQDNDYGTWRAYNNHYWPAKYLIDGRGNLRYYHFGEGKYEETEEAIRSLIEETGVSLGENGGELPDQTPRGNQTPETYLGNSRAERFFSDKKLTGGTNVYKSKDNLPLHHFAYNGRFLVSEEYSRAFAGSSLVLNFYGSKVYLVIHPAEGRENKIGIKLDGREQPQLSVTRPMLYELVNLEEKGQHLLQLDFPDDGASIFAFTFG